MSETIFETRNIIAARFTGPDHGDGRDRTMVQIEDPLNGQIVKLYPSALQGILVALHDSGLPKHKEFGVTSPCEIVTSAELRGGRIEARMVLGNDGAQGLVFVLCVDRPNDEVREDTIATDQVQALIAMQTFALGDGR